MGDDRRRPRATSALQQRGLGEPHSHAQLPLEERQHRAVMSASTWRRTTSSARASPIAATSCAFHAAEPCVPSMRADGYGQELVEQSTKLVPALVRAGGSAGAALKMHPHRGAARVEHAAPWCRSHPPLVCTFTLCNHDTCPCLGAKQRTKSTKKKNVADGLDYLQTP